MSAYTTITLEHNDSGISQLTINRPDKLNALNPDVLRDLKAAASVLGQREDLRVVVITGAGRAFVAGADIAAMAGFTREQAQEFGRLGHEAMDAIAAIPVPVIAAINGFALGGGLELAISCDLLYASDKAKLGLPEVGLGIIPGFGGTQRLGRLIGWHAARELVLTGRTLSADEAFELGLLRDVFPLEGFIDSVLEVAQLIASRGPVATRVAKEVMYQGSDLPLAQANELEQSAFSRLWDTADRLEGMTAFIEKREAEFKGR